MCFNLPPADVTSWNREETNNYKEMSMVRNYCKPVWCLWVKLLPTAIKLQTPSLPSQHASSITLTWRDRLWAEEAVSFSFLYSVETPIPSPTVKVPLWFRQFSTKRTRIYYACLVIVILKNWRNNEPHPALAWVSTACTKRTTNFLPAVRYASILQ